MKKILMLALGFGLWASQSFALDTSGCSTDWWTPRVRNHVGVSVMKPFAQSCWNYGDSGVRVTYAWYQENNSRSQNDNIGFWISLNGKTAYAKAFPVRCEVAYGGISMGHDTTGNATYLCVAGRTFEFSEFKDLGQYAYDGSGSPNVWDVQVAVSLDDAGSWDSADGKNYQFRF